MKAEVKAEAKAEVKDEFPSGVPQKPREVGASELQQLGMSKPDESKREVKKPKPKAKRRKSVPAKGPTLKSIIVDQQAEIASLRDAVNSMKMQFEKRTPASVAPPEPADGMLAESHTLDLPVPEASREKPPQVKGRHISFNKRSDVYLFYGTGGMTIVNPNIE